MYTTFLPYTPIELCVSVISYFMSSGIREHLGSCRKWFRKYHSKCALKFRIVSDYASWVTYTSWSLKSPVQNLILNPIDYRISKYRTVIFDRRLHWNSSLMCNLQKLKLVIIKYICLDSEHYNIFVSWLQYPHRYRRTNGVITASWRHNPLHDVMAS